MDEGVGGASAAPLAHLVRVYSVWGTTESSRRRELRRTASCGSTVSRAWPTAAIVAFQRHLLGDLQTPNKFEHLLDIKFSHDDL